MATKRRKTRSAAQRRATRRMIAANRARSSAPRKRRRARRNLPVGPLLNRPRRRRSYARSRTRRSYRHSVANPAIMGVQLPAMQQVLFSAVGFLAPPYLSALVTPYLPVSMNTKYGRLAVDAGAVFVLTWGTKQFIGRSESKAVMVGGAVYILTELIREFLPATSTSGTRAYLNVPEARRGQVAGMRAQPFLGSGLRGMGTQTSQVPARLDPGNRF